MAFKPMWPEEFHRQTSQEMYGLYETDAIMREYDAYLNYFIIDDDGWIESSVILKPKSQWKKFVEWLRDL